MFRGFFAFMLAIAAFVLTGNPASAQIGSNAIDPAELGAAQKVARDFLKSMRQGQKVEAEKLVSATARDELDAAFAADSKLLKSAPATELKFSFPKKFKSFDPVEYEIELVYAVKVGDKWTTAQVRTYRYDADPYRVEYWRIDNRQPNLAASSIDPALGRLPGTIAFMFLALAAAGLLAVLFIVWLVKRKPHLVAPDAPVEVRRSAATVRDE